MKKFEGIEQIGFTVNKAHNVALIIKIMQL